MEKQKNQLDNLSLGNKIRKYRNQHNWTQEQFAELLDISSGYVSQIERGDHVPSLATFVTICKVLEIEPGVLLLDSVPSNITDENYKRIQLDRYIDQINEEQLDSLLKLLQAFNK